MKIPELQQAVYNKLTGDGALMAVAQGVHAPKAPQADDGELIGPFPYVVIPQITASPFDTKTSLGGSAVVQIDGYTRSSSGLDIGELHDLVYGALHHKAVAISGAAWVDTRFESSSFGWEGDQKTRRFVALYRVVYDDI